MLLTLALLAALMLAISSASPMRKRAQSTVFANGSSNNPSNIHDGIGAGADVYKTYLGDGSAATGWPAMDQWVSFENMFNANKVNMRISCQNNAWGENNSDEEIGQLWNAIQSAAWQTKVDHRFILAIIMQESQGCVRVITTENGVTNPGLMQSHNGQSSCNGPDGILFPCPTSKIFGMVADGAGGTPDGDGLAGILNTLVSSNDAQGYYKAARQYNTGSIPDPTKLESKGAANACYASHVANRLTGWVAAASTCTLT